MSKPIIFITVDTEHSIGGAFGDPKLKPVGNEKHVFGKIGTKYYGIPLIMDIAEACDLTLTFFVEVLSTCYFGEAESRSVCEYILGRGHDIQLHIHPNYLNFLTADPMKQSYSDLMGNYEFHEQIDFIKMGMDILDRNGTPRPIAFRAGCFGANAQTLRALIENGILIDSSYNQAYLGKSCLFDDRKMNDLNCLDGIWEFPITNFVECSKVRSKRYMPLDINGVSDREIIYVLNWAKQNGVQYITLIMHSFSFVKPYDVQYQKMNPRYYVIERFRKICNYLKKHSDTYEVKTFGVFDKGKLKQLQGKSDNDFPQVPPSLSILRGFQQLRDVFI